MAERENMRLADNTPYGHRLPNRRRNESALTRLFAYVVARIVPGANSADLTGMDHGGANGSATHAIYKLSS
jgi:hypothetical protein